MGCIKVLFDEDFGLNSIKFNNPKIRKGARGIIINHDGKIAVFNKVNKNEYVREEYITKRLRLDSGRRLRFFIPWQQRNLCRLWFCASESGCDSENCRQ